MSWATIASKKTDKPVKSIVKPKEQPVIVPKKSNEISPIDVFDHHYGDKIFRELSNFTIKESGNNDLLRKNISCGGDLYHFFIDYVDIEYYAESKMPKYNDNELSDEEYYDYY